MMLIRRVVYTIILLLFYGAVVFHPIELSARTSAEAVGSGTSWLFETRFGMGMWVLSTPPDPMQTEFTTSDYRKSYIRDTLEASKTLQMAEVPVAEYQLTLDWLEIFPFTTIEQLSQKIQILSKSEKDISPAIAYIIEMRNTIDLCINNGK